MIVSNKNVVGDSSKMVPDGYIIKESGLEPLSKLQSNKLFKKSLYLLAVTFLVVVVGCVTWIVTATTLKVRTDQEVLARDVVATSYVLSKMDTTLDPCQDFYMYSCGGWIKTQKQENRYILHDTMDEYRTKVMGYLNGAPRNDDIQSYKNAMKFYQKCQTRDSSELTEDLDKVNGWLDELFEKTTSNEVLEYAADLGLSVVYPIDTETGDAATVIGLPIEFRMRISEVLRNQYVTSHPEKFGNIDVINRYIDSMIPDDVASLVKTTVEDMINSITFVGLNDYFTILGLKKTDVIMVQNDQTQKFIKFFTDNLSTEEDRTKFLKTYTGMLLQHRYLRWAEKIKTPDFCYEQALQPNFGFTIGSLMLDREKYDYTKTLETVNKMVSSITAEYRTIIQNSDILSKEGKDSAIEKLDNITFLVGTAPWIFNDIYLQELNFEGSLDEIDTFIEMYKTVKKHINMKKIRQALDPKAPNSWQIAFGPQIALNAAYYQHENAISLPNGAFIQPYFDDNWPISMQYGALGFIIGHEISHAFDRKGMQYKTKGMSNDLWNVEDSERMKSEQDCLINRYNGFGYPKYDIKVNGNMTLNENFADNAGLLAAFEAYKRAGGSDDSLHIPGLNLTSEQIFFLTFAQIRCNNIETKDDLQDLFYYDENLYSPPNFRAIGPVMNSPQFSEAFSCSQDAKMNVRDKCRTLK